MTDRLRPLWDFDDLDATEARLRQLLETEHLEERRSEVLTQLARVEGLRGRFEDCARLLEEAERFSGTSLVARTRLALERGRMLRSSGDAPAARPLFESAFALAREAREDALAADAAHMAALAAGDRTGFEEWTRLGVDLARASDDQQAAYWLGPLLNNLGCERYEAGEAEAALEAFEDALRARERLPEQEAEIEIARYAVGKALRALGRADEAVPQLERAVAWAEAAGRPDGWFHEELAEEYAALGREREAAEQARLALALLPAADPSFEPDETRVGRLRSIAGQPG
jgi:tetratricopeptide (TPR) repeat protein